MVYSNPSMAADSLNLEVQDDAKAGDTKTDSPKVESPEGGAGSQDSNKQDEGKGDKSGDQKEDKDSPRNKGEDHDKDDHDKGDHDKDGHDKDGHDKGDHGNDEHGDAGHDSAHGSGEGGEHSIEEGLDHYLDPGHLFDHVQDSHYFELPRALGIKFTDSHGHEHHGIELPNPLGVTEEKPLVQTSSGVPIFSGRPTKFMVLELVGAILLCVVFIRLAQKVRGGQKPTGRFWHALEAIVVFVRDEIAKPAIGGRDTNRFLPFLLTLFFFILVLNLFGMIPLLGSATGALAVTSVFAVATFLVVVISGMQKMGVVGFLKAQVPSMDLPPLMAMVLIPGIWLIEIFGLLVKHFVLAIRLFANMFAGHLVLAVFIGFIGAVWTSSLFWGVAPVVVIGSIALSMLELFVAFLQAYVFTFLAALFIGSAQHAH